MTRVSIVDNFKGLIGTEAIEPGDQTTENQPVTRQNSAAPAQTPVPALKTPAVGVAARAMGMVFEERDSMALELQSGRNRVVEIDPSLIDPSPFTDRLPDDNDDDFVVFRQTIADAGQKVPVEVRPHPTIPGRYQTVFGHRRIRAAGDLGQKVRAVIADVDVRQHLMAQALENAARQDLSWSERALFVQQMDGNSMVVSDICTALGVDRNRVSELRATVKAIPSQVIKAIGRAPKIGRGNWKALEAKFLADPSLPERALDILQSAISEGLPSSERFKLLSSTLTPKASTEARHSVSPAEIGKVVATAVGEDDRADFADFVRNEIPVLVKKFYAVRHSSD